MFTALVRQEGKTTGVKRSILASQMLLGGRMPACSFSYLPDGDNTKYMTPGMLEREKKLYEERVSAKEKRVREVERLTALKLREDFDKGENKWWNALATIEISEYKLMPMGFIKKYGSYINNLYRFQKDAQL